MKILIPILFLSFTLTAFGQESLIDSSDSGIIIKAKVKAEATNLMVRDRKEGNWMEYRNNEGDISADTNSPYYSLSIYHKGKLSGTMRMYDEESGELFMEIPYDAKGKENGIEKQYYESGKIEYERTYVNDKRNGILKEYYESGKLEMQNQWQDDELMGLSKFYYESGKLQEEDPYTNDVLNGTVKEYYESGVLKDVTAYNNGEKGTAINYDENGSEIK
jgi:antitoxin component YwqK of YwqJK toxin-antitoxin module